MKNFTVYGQALAPVGVTYYVDADNEQDAIKEAMKQWNSGKKGAVNYLCDDEAAIDFAADRVGITEGM